MKHIPLFKHRPAIAVLAALLAGSGFGFAQTNPTPQSLPLSQNFGTTTFTTMPAGFAVWNGVSGGTVSSQALAEASAPTGNATIATATAVTTTGGAFGYMVGGNARPYIQTASNATNGVNQVAMALNCTGWDNIVVGYEVEVISAQPRTVGVVCQYRIGSTGSWTTLTPTTGSNPYSQAGGTTGIKSTVQATLPSAANNQPIVQVRWALWRGTETGNSSGIGIDNVSATGTPTGDVAPPTISTLTPADDATGVSATTNLVALFNEPIVKGTGDITLKLVSDNSTVFTIPVTDAAVAVAGSTATITLPSSLAGLTGYYVNIASGAFKDLANNSFAGIADASPWSFTTASHDTTPPAISSTSPADDSSTAFPDSDLVISYDEPITALSGTILLKKVSDDSVVESISVPGAQVAVSGSSATINPSTILAYGTAYYVEIIAGTFKDAANNATLAVTGNSFWNFSTRAVLSVVTSLAATGVTTSEATVGGNITATGGTNVTTRGVEYSTTENFENGTGTRLLQSGDFGMGIFAITLSGLPSNTTFYYKAFATNSEGIAYGIQQSFTTAKDLSDEDGDGITAYDELMVYATNPELSDSDGDGLNDGDELGIGRFSIVTGSFTWQQARNDATSKGGDLASFPIEDRWNRALQGLGTNPFETFTGLWIGASDAGVEGTWVWVNGEPFSYAHWGTGRPSSTSGNTLDFAEVSGGGGAEIGKWYDRSSSTIRDGYLLETGYASSPTLADTDGDGLNDGQELTAGSHPKIADSDSDGLSDSQEVNLTQTNPVLTDTDGNGTDDANSDQDGDGLGNLAEVTQFGTDPLKADTDGDSLTDSEELSYSGSYFTLIEGSFTHAQASDDAAKRRGRLASLTDINDFIRLAARARKTTQNYLWLGLSDAVTEGAWLWTDGSVTTYSRWLNGQPDGGAAENHAVLMENSNQWADAAPSFVASGYLFERSGLDPVATDTDGDGLTDGAEINSHQTNPVIDDTDGDGLADGVEINTYGSNPKLADTDSDGLSDFVEVDTHDTNPTAMDTDSDGFDDLFEINTGFNPKLQSSTPDALSSIRTAVEFRFNAANGVNYRIEASIDLLTWETVETDIIGTGGVLTRFYSTENKPKRYFRVKRN